MAIYGLQIFSDVLLIFHICIYGCPSYADALMDRVFGKPDPLTSLAIIRLTSLPMIVHVKLLQMACVKHAMN
jgi:hypothetical protein